MLPQEALNLSSTSKQMSENVDLAKFNDTFSFQDERELTDMHWSGPRSTGHEERIWFRFMPLILGDDRVHTIQFKCQFKDQGWGNRKGKLYVREDKNPSNFQGEVVAQTPIAEHHKMNVTLEFQPKTGKNYTMCFVVGGGGGHELFVYNPCILTLVYGRKIATVAAQFQKKSLKPILKNPFVVGLMKTTIASLIRSLDCGEQQDEDLASCFTKIGFDTTKKDILETIMDFVDTCVEFQSSALLPAVAHPELDSNDSDYHDDSSQSDESFSSGSSNLNDEMEMDVPNF